MFVSSVLHVRFQLSLSAVHARKYAPAAGTGLASFASDDVQEAVFDAQNSSDYNQRFFYFSHICQLLWGIVSPIVGLLYPSCVIIVPLAGKERALIM